MAEKKEWQDQGYIVDVFSSLKSHEHSKYSNQIIDRIESYRIIEKDQLWIRTQNILYSTFEYLRTSRNVEQFRQSKIQ